ncbi:MAG: beta-1,6-N-acetylglucosaminyltransferase, partial [Geobacteraceae bacterium]
MRIAYLLLVHNTPNHLQRLLSALKYKNDDFYIHVDRKSSCSFENEVGERIYFTRERIPVYWGEFSQVEAILMLIRQALNTGNKYDYFILLSGSDYPIRSPGYIHNYLQKNYGDEFINVTEMPNDELGKPLTRITEYRVGSDKPLRRYIYEKIVGCKRLFGAGYFRRDFSKIFGDIVPYSGSTWWALTGEACKFVVDFTSSHKICFEFFRNTLCPDEMFFQTVLGNSEFGKRVTHNVTYADWDRFGPPFPAVLNDWHLQQFMGQRPYYAVDSYG